MNIICETDRLIIRQFDLSETDFILRLLNDESFIRNIADKQVRTQEDAIHYLSNGPIASYRTHGFGLNLVSLKSDNTAIGICGLLKREELTHPDLGYAFLPEFCGQGYAREAAEAVLSKEMRTHALQQVLAVTYPDNLRSNHLLKAIGFRLKGTMTLYGVQNNCYLFSG